MSTAATVVKPTLHRRFGIDQRLEHVLLIASFTTLAVTGLPQKFAAAPVSQVVIALLGGIETVRIIHRIAATLMMLETVYHFAAIGYRLVVRHARFSMLPTLQDARDALQQFLYNIGLARQPAQLGRYTFEEKAEYWALIWGTVVMVITGFMLWNPIATTRFLPGEFIPAAKAAHGGEALLAVLAIILWHMWGVHVRHFNKSMWTGHLTEEEMLHEHPLELADIKAGTAQRPVDPALQRKRQQVYLPAAGVVSLVLLAGVAWFVSFEQTAITTVPPLSTVQAFVPLTPTPLPPTPTPPPVGALTWNGYIGSLFTARCSACHGVAGGLSLADYASAIQGSRSGPVIVTGDSAGSRIAQIQEAGGHPGQLSPEELARLKQWIDLGAPER